MQSCKGNGVEAFFNPETVAIFGSFREWGGHGSGVIENMLKLGYKGRIYPVSSSRSEVMGWKTYPAIEEVDGSVDLAVIITPSSTVPGVIEQCSRKGVKAAVVVSEHFAEAGEDGTKLQQQLVEIASHNGIRIMGPNTIGVLNAHNGLVTNPYLFDSHNIRRGGIAYCSQTGIAAAQCQPLADRSYGISKMCDIGNKCNVDEVDIIDYLANDPETNVIAMHLEDVKNGRRFIDAAQKLTARKPLLVLKSGRSEAGAQASASHTGSLTGNDQVYDAALKQAGAIRISSWQEYWEVPKIFDAGMLPEGNRIGIISYSGGAGVVAADVAVDIGLRVPCFTPDTMNRLSKLSPRLAGNPIDLGPILSSAYDPVNAQDEALTAVLNDDNIDCAVIGMYVGRLAPKEYVADLFDRIVPRISKPFTLWLYGPTLCEVEELARRLEERGVPVYTEFETAIKALGIAVKYVQMRSNLSEGRD